MLEEVARPSAKDSGYLLRDDFYRLVQKDWPGYSEEERQLLGRVLARKSHMQNGSQSRAFLPNPLVPKTSEDSTQNLNTAKNQTVKRPVPPDPQESGALKRPRLVDTRQADTRPADARLADGRLRLPPPPVTTTATSSKIKGGRDQTSPVTNPDFHAKTEIQATAAQGHVAAAPNGFLLTHKLSDVEAGRVGPVAPVVSPIAAPVVSPIVSPVVSPVAAPVVGPRRPSEGGSPDAGKHQALTNSQHKKKKSKKHKDKERERTKDKAGHQWMESSPDHKQSLDKLHDPELMNAVPSEEKPDYVLKYPSITSPEQRQRYQTDFCEEYSEYIDLHSRIATITHMFVQLASKIKSLSPGTQQYKIMEDQIMEKYKKYRNKFPGYREEKKRCEYLHEKLSHIKQLITDYDVTQTSSS